MRRAVIAGVAALLLVMGSAAGVAWYYAGEVEREALAIGPPPSPFDLVVKTVGGGEITLQPTEATDWNKTDLDKPGRYGLASTDGSGVVGEILGRDGDSVTRTLIGFDAAIAPGDKVRLRALAHTGDPLTDLGLAFDDIALESDVGRLGAWYVEGPSATWAIVVYGRGVGRSDGLKVLATLVELGLPTLVIQYRNDAGVARSASGFYDYGLSEWRDLEAAVAYALDHGAEDVVLIGNSMGGAVVVNFLYRSDLAGRVRGIVLDSPVLDFEDVVDFGAEDAISGAR